MNIIVAGQRIVTAAEFAEVSMGFDLELEPVTFDTAAGQDALADIVAELEREADTDVDAEDLAHYRSLLGSRIVRLPRRATTHFERGVAA
ncbi:hypothetical protein [Streptomyces swartbergensis]|uniref:Uncharacterized protein n=1 Tax=Streptomyces swartbergensis TaxID=487165 RepID=A0A243S7X8_9ACTN|nr:hypothetical protein [Streptomyces swartbergensis]OUD03021.1 hypothetical protein CA983_11865 [Streptomyces swartbergensis]